MRLGARRIQSIAYERAIEGTIRRHYFHGELKSEERVFDNRLLIYLLGKVERHLEPTGETAAVAANWQPWVEAIEQGAPAPDLHPPEPEEPDAGQAIGEPDEADESDELWQDEGGEWWTSYPPPERFDGYEQGEPGTPDYKRDLTPAEQAVMDAHDAAERAETLAGQIDRRDAWFGFAGGVPEDLVFSCREAELSETSEPFEESRHGSDPNKNLRSG